jgi:serine/threonine-protein kinase RsbT
MSSAPEGQLPLVGDHHIVLCRQAVRRMAKELGFSLVDETKLVTAASELARNVIVHGGGGTMSWRILSEGLRRGLCLTFEDRGPGIADIKLALTDGYTTAGGLGLGLAGARRLVNEFDIKSALGEGTRVTITRWRG